MSCTMESGGFPGSSAGKESTCNAGDPSSLPGLGRFPWRRVRLPTPGFLGFPGGSDGKESACSAGDLGSIPGLGRSPGEGSGNSLQYSCLENPYRQRSLVGYSPWGHRELETTGRLSRAQRVEGVPEHGGCAESRHRDWLPRCPSPPPAILTPLWTEKGTIEDRERALGPRIYLLKNTCDLFSRRSLT